LAEIIDLKAFQIQYEKELERTYCGDLEQVLLEQSGTDWRAGPPALHL
jgi:hypothetical protein